MQAHQRIHQPVVGTGTDAEHQRFVKPVGDDIGVAHRRIEIDALTGLERDRVVELRVDLDLALEHIDESSP